MAYYINIFSPETYLAFSDSNREISGFRDHRKKLPPISIREINLSVI